MDAVVQAAAAAFQDWQDSSGAQRAALLRALATALEAERAALVALADDETHLGPVRLNGELDRTAFQLRRFADLAERGVPLQVLDDPAVAGAPPAGHPHLRRIRVPLGPVAMFAASNFPFAFSVLGGDTASALAAGCAVVVKAHPGHPQLSAQTHALIQRVLAALELPAGLIGLVQGGVDEGLALIRHPAIAACAFTGSTRGGAALQAEARARPRPIPFYGELGSVNPVVALPAALGEPLAQALAGSITLGCGQFCTSPGVLLLLDSAEGRAANDHFLGRLRAALQAAQPHPMLTPGMRSHFEAGTAAWHAAGGQALLHEPGVGLAPRPVLMQLPVADFVREEALRHEVFGPACLVLRCASLDEVEQVLAAIGGSLTVTLWGVGEDGPDARRLLRAARAIAGRVLFGGMPTGVAVCAGQQHGGPWPSSTEPLFTSVGDAALDRFLRPVALQDAPDWAG
jgi:NADP-dependent aldehyde dehydrogenase